MHPCHGEHDPFCYVCGMVADTLKILCDHQQIKCKLAVTRIGRNAFNQILLDTIK